VALAICAAAGCSGPSSPGSNGREVAVRIDDVVYGRTQVVPGSTVLYPRAWFGDDVRFVLHGKLSGGVPPTSRTHAAAVVEVPRDARLEFSYGVDGKPGAPPVTFRVTAARSGSPRVVFEVTATPGDAKPAWKDATVDLSGWQGSVELRFTTSEAAAGATPDAPTAAYFTAPIITVPVRDSAPRNLILVSLDTLRADHLGVYGYERPTSPNIDRIFSHDGVVVDRVLTQASATPQAHVALLTGMNPTTALQAVPGAIKRVQDWVVTLAEVLSRRGYQTAAFTEDGMLIWGAGFQRGFDVYHESKHVASSSAPAGIIEETFGRGLAWLEAHRDERFFLFLHTYQVHDPYLSPPDYQGHFPTPPDAEIRQHEIDAYDRAILYTDDWVRALLERVDALGLGGRTMVAVTADHGEEFGEHGWRRHGTHLTSEILHVPLLLRGAPGLAPGSRRAGPMALVDVMPTFLDLLGVPIPDQCEGRSLAAHLRTGEPPTPAAMFAESHATYAPTYDGFDSSWHPPGYALTRWPYRLVRVRTEDGARYELFDLDADPGERKNLYDERRAAVEPDRAALEGYEAGCKARQDALALRLTGKPLVQGPAGVPVDPAVAEKLKALGYVQ
jgi:arylsulfatase A-like enzyme